MKDIYLVKYSVKGIKSLNELISLSFYKKTISKEINTQEYNIKGIYGMNGSGKTAIITSIDILKNLLTNSGYLNNPVAQKQLNETINKNSKELYIEAEYLYTYKDTILLFKYCIYLVKDSTDKFIISYEELSVKPAKSKVSTFTTIFKTSDGAMIDEFLNLDDMFTKELSSKTANLLSMSSLSSVFFEKFFASIINRNNIPNNYLFTGLCTITLLGQRLQIHLEDTDTHKNYLLFKYNELFIEYNLKSSNFMKHFVDMYNEPLNIILITDNYIHKDLYGLFEKKVEKLCKFIRIFKPELNKIEIEKKENRDSFVCDLIMNYGSYKIHAEFESTGIKKLIKLYSYINAMVQGDIVFIDEFDSNLHDVYLCALLEYLMEYAQGQLCFTTHNVGPMDVLKQNKKSIDFLSTDNTIYPWKTNGNYSPSKLYRNGMIEGSPFNVEAIDFIEVFSLGEECE